MSARPFEPSGLSRRLAALAAATTRLSTRRAGVITILALALIGVADKITDPEINLIVCYLLLTCFAAWSLGLTIGLAVGVTTVTMAATLNGFHFGFPLPRQSSTGVAILWNTCSRLLATGVVVVLATGLRGALDLERRRAETDMLTGAFNKRAFLARMDGAVARARHASAALVLAYLDLDGFKAINDGYGHAAGDAVLCAFAEAGTAAIRRTDLFARFGGDEFVVLLTVPDCAQGDSAAEILHARLAEILRATGYPVTCSMGALVLEADGFVDRSAMIDAADRLMYEVKHAGKNAIRLARADLPPRRAAPASAPGRDRKIPARSAA